jgi:hypothetical protein
MSLRIAHHGGCFGGYISGVRAKRAGGRITARIEALLRPAGAASPFLVKKGATTWFL